MLQRGHSPYARAKIRQDSQHRFDGGPAPRRSEGAYAASKAAVLRHTKGLAVSLAPHNINVNAICPGAVWKRFQEAGALSRQRRDQSLARKDPEQIFLEQYDGVIPLGRPQTPEDIGKMTAFLISEDARNVTGQCVPTWTAAHSSVTDLGGALRQTTEAGVAATSTCVYQAAGLNQTSTITASPPPAPPW